MKNLTHKLLSKLIDRSLYLFVRFITGIRPKPAKDFDFPTERNVYYANHGSHGDFVMVWIALPKAWRNVARPVAGADYWLKGKIRPFIINHVFNGLLIMRNGNNPSAITAQMSQALTNNDSLIIFPEGTRNTDDNVLLLPFKSGIYHLARENPDVRFIPIWIDNINRVLPKGQLAPVPLICDVNIGKPIQIQENEDKDAFLTRTRNALLDLAPAAKRVAYENRTTSQGANT
ncbi:MAG: lysophospholipid acyltransferase family protein [Alysiella sp.]|uniref:lysophospholipid acyltransferase family protein n=1 Tax=Alysiella sp. TaxID=1872483 RepID=UPI0026DC2DB3|nr:lysophospholipid acyltransferase family protein [Alysiella sp.]MDO4434294.1 lysophospholipid acyltransferase family protein [Alysiella sp.]